MMLNKNNMNLQNVEMTKPMNFLIFLFVIKTFISADPLHFNQVKWSQKEVLIEGVNSAFELLIKESFESQLTLESKLADKKLLLMGIKEYISQTGERKASVVAIFKVEVKGSNEFLYIGLEYYPEIDNYHNIMASSDSVIKNFKFSVGTVLKTKNFETITSFFKIDSDRKISKLQNKDDLNFENWLSIQKKYERFFKEILNSDPKPDKHIINKPKSRKKQNLSTIKLETYDPIPPKITPFDIENLSNLKSIEKNSNLNQPLKTPNPKRNSKNSKLKSKINKLQSAKNIFQNQNHHDNIDKKYQNIIPLTNSDLELTQNQTFSLQKELDDIKKQINNLDQEMSLNISFLENTKKHLKENLIDEKEIAYGPIINDYLGINKDKDQINLPIPQLSFGSNPLYNSNSKFKSFDQLHEEKSSLQVV